MTDRISMMDIQFSELFLTQSRWDALFQKELEAKGKPSIYRFIQPYSPQKEKTTSSTSPETIHYLSYELPKLLENNAPFALATWNFGKYIMRLFLFLRLRQLLPTVCFSDSKHVSLFLEQKCPNTSIWSKSWYWCDVTSKHTPSDVPRPTTLLLQDYTSSFGSFIKSRLEGKERYSLWAKYIRFWYEAMTPDANHSLFTIPHQLDQLLSSSYYSLFSPFLVSFQASFLCSYSLYLFLELMSCYLWSEMGFRFSLYIPTEHTHLSHACRFASFIPRACPLWMQVEQCETSAHRAKQQLLKDMRLCFHFCSLFFSDAPFTQSQRGLLKERVDTRWVPKEMTSFILQLSVLLCPAASQTTSNTPFILQPIYFMGVKTNHLFQLWWRKDHA